jgi:glycine/D-amino acid oxidase-like deaminating enzyme
MRAPTQPIQTIEADVAIIGGGVAGCLAALGAAEVGAKTVICEKGGIIERSGSVAAGVDHYTPFTDAPFFMFQKSRGTRPNIQSRKGPEIR